MSRSLLFSAPFPPSQRQRLEAARDRAWRDFCGHNNPGGLTPAECTAFELEHEALELLLLAAQTRLDAETELQALLQHERG